MVNDSECTTCCGCPWAQDTSTLRCEEEVSKNYTQVRCRRRATAFCKARHKWFCARHYAAFFRPRSEKPHFECIPPLNKS